MTISHFLQRLETICTLSHYDYQNMNNSSIPLNPTSQVGVRDTYSYMKERPYIRLQTIHLKNSSTHCLLHQPPSSKNVLIVTIAKADLQLRISNGHEAIMYKVCTY